MLPIDGSMETDGVPVARAEGDLSYRTRMLYLRDGIAACIRYCPVGHRDLETVLRRAWMMARERIEKEEAECQLPWIS
jgi:hypothetical protein